ncbi:hypothetical protein [Pseudolysinimonas sp.]|uniref:hypothetical protein n=1 Tax=Pseudolysinimonas sp. TaxID=2680009 RepID=UPI003F7EDEF2
MPGFVLTRLDLGPAELESALPLRADALRVMPGSDRPDYLLARFERPLKYRTPVGFDMARADPALRGRDEHGDFVIVQGIVVCARFVGQGFTSGMRDLAINIAYVIDNSLANDASVDFTKLEYVAVGFIDDAEVAAPA